MTLFLLLNNWEIICKEKFSNVSWNLVSLFHPNPKEKLSQKELYKYLPIKKKNQK